MGCATSRAVRASAVKDSASEHSVFPKRTANLAGVVPSGAAVAEDVIPFKEVPTTYKSGKPEPQEVVSRPILGANGRTQVEDTAVERSGSSFGSTHSAASDGSDWDRYSAASELATSPAPSGRSDALESPVMQSGGTPDPADIFEEPGDLYGSVASNSRSRQPERSLFGLTERRQHRGLKETSSLKLAKMRGCTFVNQYVVIKYLGRGACGRVFLCMDMEDNRLYAVKMVKKGDLEKGSKGARRKRNPIEDLRREVAIMRTLRHKNIVSLQEVVDDPRGNKMLLVMDYMEGGPVMTRDALEAGRVIPESLALQYFRDMVKALDYLHYHRVVHGDLKPENVLMSARGNVTLGDFGCSKVISGGNELLERCNGTPAFLAPEMMRPSNRYRGRPTDVYALGACLFTFVYGRIPFNAPNVVKLFQVVQNEPLRFPEQPVISRDLKDLLSAMLCKDPKQRITVRQIMRHRWTTNGGQWPLKSIKEMLREGLGEQEGEYDLKATQMPDFLTTVMDAAGPGMDALPDMMMTANVLDVPRQDHMWALLKAAQEERSYVDGEYLVRQGEQSAHVMYILEGQVEVLLKLPGSAPSHRAARRRAGPDEADLIGDDLPPSLLEGASKAHDFTSVLQRGNREFLVAVRSEGQFVGEMALFAGSGARCASVRTRGPVCVKVISAEDYAATMNNVPQAKQQAQEMVWMKQSENMVLEAITRLSTVHDALEEMLQY